MTPTELEKEAVHSPLNLNSEPQKKPEQATMTAFASYSGPIPPPNFLTEYERMVPGIAKRFLDEPHLEAEHRRSLERMMTEEQIKLANRGQTMAFILGSFCVIGAFGAIFFGYSLEGLGVLVASIAAFVGIFYRAKKKQ